VSGDPVERDLDRYLAGQDRWQRGADAFDDRPDDEKLEDFFFGGSLKDDEYRAGFLVEYLMPGPKKEDSLTGDLGCLPTKKSDILWRAIREHSDLQQEWTSYREKWIREYLGVE